MKLSPYVLLAFLLSITTSSNGHELLRGKLPILEQESYDDFVAEIDGARDTLSLSEDCEQVLVVVRHGQDYKKVNGIQPHPEFPDDIPHHIQAKYEDVYAWYYALDPTGHATAMFLRDHLDSFLESNNYCKVKEADVVRPGKWDTSNPLTTLSPWAKKHRDRNVKYNFVANDDQHDDGAHNNKVGLSTPSGSRLIVSTANALWAEKVGHGDQKYYPRINSRRVLAKMLNDSPDDFCLPRHGKNNFIYIYRGMQGNGKWSTVEQRIYNTDTGKISSTRYACKGADNTDNRTPV